MAKTNSERQAEWRNRLKRDAAHAAQMAAALEQIAEKVAGNTKPLAVEIATLAREGLEGRKDET